ncbi:hypothetical protein QL093DRAFT_2223335 [Fusarium oxysporum]|nr:hypothetical protein QL093DRAFT_2223335 [Fusarium oxysporum]
MRNQITSLALPSFARSLARLLACLVGAVRCNITLTRPRSRRRAAYPNPPAPIMSLRSQDPGILATVYGPVHCSVVG